MKTRRELLRRRRRERQFIVFGALIFALGAVAYMAYSIYTGKIEGPFAAPFVTNAGNFSSDITLPCPPTNETPAPASEVLVRVRNSTERTGLAATTLSDLIGRGFLDGGADNFRAYEYEGTVQVIFGIDGVREGYTVARNFEDPELILDSREGAGVDVIMGTKFDKLVPIYSPDLDPELVLTATGECLPAALITPVLAPRNYPKPSPAPTVEPSNEPSSVSGDDGIAD
jgi:hypothetical protein